MSDTRPLQVKEASWPEDAPHRLEENVMSVVCGNTHLHWAVHTGKKNDFAPILFWRYVGFCIDIETSENIPTGFIHNMLN
jgi:hypothetical protein